MSREYTVSSLLATMGDPTEGSSASAKSTDADKKKKVKQASTLETLGFGVALNKPYAGGYITEHYGRPHKAQHVLQIEVNRALYMDETTFERSDHFDALRDKLEAVIRELMPVIPDLIVPRAAAE